MIQIEKKKNVQREQIQKNKDEQHGHYKQNRGWTQVLRNGR
jgi:hypothetical protein